MSGQLAGKVALVTGGGKGIGRAIALAYADEGADVAVVGRDEAALQEVADAIAARGRTGLALAGDISDVAGLPALFDRATEALGALDVLVNNAGQQHTAPAEELTEAQWDATMDTNLKALFFCSQEAGRRFLARGEGGRIVNVGSTYSVVAWPEFSAYCASKGGVIQLTRALAVEWAKHGINVNAVGPTAVYTDMMREMLDDPGFREAYLPRVPGGEFPQPEDIAAAAVFLAGPGSRFVHGQQLLVDGGYTVM
jgi:NAD(P)-dependent dehydrogenase (short-subunit alcohol dehydrogenase family)